MTQQAGPSRAERLVALNEIASLAGRFWDKVERGAAGECWRWLGASTCAPHAPTAPYGLIWFQGTHIRAHRLALILTGQAPEEGEQVDHLCRNTLCVNPAHLEWVDAATNTRRSQNPTAVNLRKTHCKHGHPLSGDNLAIDHRGGRRCLACRRFNQKRYAERRRARAAGLDGAR